jgi:foldase protein PrsA
MRYFSKVVLNILIIAILFSFSGCKENPVVGKVNGEELLTTDYKYFLESVKTTMLIESGISASDTDSETKISEYWNEMSNQTKAKTKAYDDLVKFKIQYANAKKDKYKLSKIDEDDFNNKFAEKYEKNEDFKNQLDEILGIDMEKFKELTYNTFYVSMYEEQESNKIEVTDSQIKEYYDKNKDKFQTTTVRHILFLTEEKTDKEKEEAKKKAEDILEKVRAGEDMIQLAEKNSEDQGVTENKGEYEVKKDGQMAEAFEDWAVSANVGDTGIIETYYGYHVIKCEKKSTIEDVKNAVKKAIQKEKYFEKVKASINDKDSEIEKNQNEIDKVKVF